MEIIVYCRKKLLADDDFRLIVELVLSQWVVHSVVVSALASINVVSRHWARLVLGWVTACGRVNDLGM